MSDTFSRVRNNNESSEIVLESSLQAFFFDQLYQVNQKSSSPLPQETIYYSSLVMDRFGESLQYFEQNEQGKFREKTLGKKLLEASQMSDSSRRSTLKDIGDTALLLCGYFSDSLNKKIVDTTYYHDIGRIAYQRLDHIIPEAYEVPSFFRQLSKSFEALTEIMSVVSRQNSNESEQGLESSYLLFVSKSRIKAS